MYQVADFGRGSASHKDLEQSPVDWERGIIFHFKSILHLEALQNRSYQVVLSCTSCICEVSSWILARLSLYTFLENSSIRISWALFISGYFWCEFLEVLFLVEPILHEAWPALFEIVHHTHNLHSPFPNDWNELVFWNSRMEVLWESTLHSCFKIWDFASARRWSLCSSRTHLEASSGSENLNKVSSFSWLGWPPEENSFSVGKCFLTRLYFVWDHCGKFPCTFSEVTRSWHWVFSDGVINSLSVGTCFSLFWLQWWSQHIPYLLIQIRFRRGNRNALSWMTSGRHTRCVEEHRL